MLTPEFPRLSSITETISSFNADPALIKEIQTILKNTGYYKGDIDGIVGDRTQDALALFKKHVFLSYPAAIGKTTAQALITFALNKHDAPSEAIDRNQSPLPSGTLGSATGSVMRLPDGLTVHANQLIVEHVPLTWGEFTKDCTRIPEDVEHVANAIKYAKCFGWVREKWGSPIAMTSGYRPPQVNREVGGVSNSQHLYAKAGDIYPIEGDIYELLNVVKASPFVGIGLGMYRGFIHTDVRNSDRVVFPY